MSTPIPPTLERLCLLQVARTMTRHLTLPVDPDFLQSSVAALVSQNNLNRDHAKDLETHIKRFLSLRVVQDKVRWLNRSLGRMDLKLDALLVQANAEPNKRKRKAILAKRRHVCSAALRMTREIEPCLNELNMFKSGGYHW